MGPELPQPIAAYFTTQAKEDWELFAACFAPDASVRDEGRTHSGRAAIATWMSEAKKKYRHAAEPLSITERDGKTVVAVKLSGAFPGSPIQVDHAFTLDGGLISRLEIG